MEEFIEVQISSDLRKISKKDFISIKELVSFKQLQESKIDLTLNEESFRVVNIFLYYIIMIQKNVKVFQFQKSTSYGEEYRQLCLRQISDYYIKNQMKIQIYDFSVVCSKILCSKIQECAHIIYYLIYGRFASHQYINTICNKRDSDNKKRIFSRNQKQNLQLHKKYRKSTVMACQNQHQLKQFSQQLQKALRSKPKITGWGMKQSKQKNQKQQTRQNQNQSYHQNVYNDGSIKIVEQRKTLNRGNSTNNFIPHRIGQKQNSSILQSFSFCQKQYKTCTNWNKKGLMRKLKFNENFDVNQVKVHSRYQKNNNCDSKKDNSDFGDKYARSSNQKMGKISYANFKNISKQLKIKNTNLDKIRFQCSTTSQKDQAKNNIQKLFQNTAKTQENQNNKSKPSIQVKNQNSPLLFAQFGNSSTNQMENTNSISKNIPTLKKSPTLLQQTTNFKDLHLQRFISYQMPLVMTKKQSYISQIEKQVQQEEEQITNLLRNDFNYKSKIDEQVTRFNYFSSNSVNNMKKQINGRLSLQKYKNDYRKFLKTQILDRIKQAS